MSGLRFGLSLSMQGRDGGRFGAHSPAGYLLGNEPAGMAIDFASMDMLIRGGGLNWKGDPNGKLTYTSPSTKWITNRHGLLASGTTLRCDHDASTLDTSASTHDSLGVGNGGVVRKTITTSGAVTYVAGQDIVASDASDIAKWMAGRVVSYAGGSLVVDFRAASGYFACSSWKIIVALGLLVEEQRTNLFIRSSDLTVSPWAPVRATVSGDAAIAPDGTTTADKIVEDATAGNNHHLNRGLTGYSTYGTHVFSIHLKQGERRYAMVRITGGANGTPITGDVVVDLQTGQVTATGGTPSAYGVIPAPGGFWRVWVAAAHSTGSQISGTVFLQASGSYALNPTYNGDGTSGIYAWGAQLEAGSFPTSYIPTTSAQVTRAADNISLANSLYPFNFDEGTLVAEATIEGENVNDNRLAVIGNATASYRSIDLSRSSNDSILLSTVINNAQTGVGETGNKNTLGQILRAAGAYKANDFAVCLDGGALSTDLTGSVPTTTVDNLMIGRFPPNIRYLNGHIKSLVYLPRRASNSELQAMTA